MKKLFKYILYVLLPAAMLTSCEGFLEQQPITSLSTDISLSDFDGLDQATIANYAVLYHEDYYGAEFNIFSDLRGDNAKSSPLNSGRYQQYYNWTQDPSTTHGMWDDAYFLLSGVNNVLETIETDYELEAGLTQADIDHLRAENLFLRALVHHDLVRVYAQSYSYAKDQSGAAALGVPIVLRTEIAQPERATVVDVYNQIVDDLLDAESLFKAGFNAEHRADAPNHKAFASQAAVQALLARVYLYMEDYDKAAEYAGKVIANADYSLFTVSEYPRAWGNMSDASEVIFLVYGSGLETYAPFWEEIGYIYDGSASYGDVCASNDLLSQFNSTEDIRDTSFMFAEFVSGYFWPLKYPGKEGDTRQNDIPVFRLSEMYLIRAEAALNGASGDASADINAIRLNRGVDEITVSNIDEILNERRRELCFEGHAFFDHKRLGIPIDRDNEDNLITGDVDIPFPDVRWAMPIPIAEMEANDNITQNPL